MEGLFVITFISFITYLVFIINRLYESKKFKLKMLKTINTQINESIYKKDEKRFDLFLRERSKVNLFTYLFSFKKLKLHNFLTRECMNYINIENKVLVNKMRENRKNKFKSLDLETDLRIYENCGTL